MSDAEYIGLPAPTKNNRSFLKTWKGFVLLVFICAVLAAGCFSWWIAQGKVSSAYARVDTVVYTVEPVTLAQVSQILVREGEDVSSGQTLAIVDPNFGQIRKSDALEGGNRKTSPIEERERQLAARLERILGEEAKYRKIHHDRVTEHVRAQLALRAADPGRPEVYEPASQQETDARNRMNKARDEFERISKQRATLDQELAQLHYEMARKRPRRATASEKTPDPVPVPVPEAAASDLLYAPVSGKIMAINIAAGQTVHRGQPLFMIMPHDSAASWIQAWFPLSARQMLNPGQKALIKAGNLHLEGKIADISPEPQTFQSPTGKPEQYLSARIMMANPADLAGLAPGTQVGCQIQTRHIFENGFF